MPRRYRHRGACHCGNIELELATDKSPQELGARADTCGFCRRHDARYTSDPAGELELRIRDEQGVTRYRFGTKTADFLLCNQCGIFVAALTPEPSLAVINVNVMEDRDGFLSNQAAPIDLDGETLSERIARRRARWTPLRVGS